jgi:hypothetical protein
MGHRITYTGYRFPFDSFQYWLLRDRTRPTWVMRAWDDRAYRGRGLMSPAEATAPLYLSIRYPRNSFIDQLDR